MTGDARDYLHAKCDCVPDLGPAHCHLCGAGRGETVPWAECSAVRDAPSALPVPDGDVREKIARALCEGTDSLWDDLTEQERVWHYRDADSILAAFPILSAAAPEPEWEYGTAHADDPQAVDTGYSLEGAQRRVALWNASDPERKGIVMRAPRRVWEPLPVGGETA